MQELSVKLDNFSFDAFSKAVLDFAGKLMNEGTNPTRAIVWVDEVGEAPNYPEKDERDFIREMVKEKKVLLFPFTTFNEQPMPCADQNNYVLEDDLEERALGTNEYFGFLLKVTDGILIINAGYHFLGACQMPARVDIKTDCGVLNEPMSKFIRKFISS